ncbi:disulfide bond formation protein B [Sporosarcina sp. Marseille-Q4063]|uniref:disulfide oxidoreductase n=1 Tax=Sporosarcina sp. Marseille-Q4063 TaxID=2810514 RepID=UPI001BAEE09D|nr:disulfide oxidoreductase [Sporosarcina sp. Marseille-Q4063]QUW23467.1 disulfide bond formation protein B [Sporosarcina sp. Marseille-Q4063]
MQKRQENGLIFISIVSLVATLGSLYFSQIRGFEPCTLCWYQRILMYPIILIAGIGLFQKNANSALTTAVFAFIGGGISLYHYGIQKLAFLSDSAPACGDVPCTGQYINYFGFVTIPFLALLAFLLIAITSLFMMKWQKETK